MEQSSLQYPFNAEKLVVNKKRNMTFAVYANQPFHHQGWLIDFTLSNARRFYSSKGDPLVVKGLSCYNGGDVSVIVCFRSAMLKEWTGT